MLIARALNDPDHHGSPFEIAKLFLYLLLSDFNYCLISIAKSFYCSFICFCLPKFEVSVMTCGGVQRASSTQTFSQLFSSVCLFSWIILPLFPGALNQHEANLLVRLGRILKFISQFPPLAKLLFTIKHSSSEL